MPLKPKVIIVGSSNTDLVVSCDHLPVPGESSFGDSFHQYHGGKGANQAVAAARAGMEVCFIGCRGKDSFGIQACRRLSAEKIRTKYFVEVGGCPSGVASIILGGKKRENIIAVAAGANKQLTGKHVINAQKEFVATDIVVAQLEIPMSAVQTAARLARKNDIPFILNPAPVQKIPASLYRLIHVITPNEIEAAQLTGCPSPENAAKRLLRFGCKNVVITLGSRGALIANDDGVRKITAPRVKPVDTVGAGDCFTGWLAAGLAEGLALNEAVLRAIKAASISVTRHGAQDSMPYRREVI